MTYVVGVFATKNTLSLQLGLNMLQLLQSISDLEEQFLSAPVSLHVELDDLYVKESPIDSREFG